MKKSAVLFALLAAGTICAAAETAAPASIVKEGSFEVKKISRVQFGKWVQMNQEQPGPTASLDTGVFVDGKQALKMTASDPNYKNYFQVRYMLPEMKPETTYQLSFYLKTDKVVLTGKSGGAMLNIWDGNNLWFPKAWVSGTNDWKQYRFTFKTGAKTNRDASARAHVACCLYFATGNAWFDKIELTEIVKK